MNLKTFRIVAVAEAGSWLLMLVAMAFKYGADQPAGVAVMGPIHGLLFLAYAACVLFERDELGWKLKTMAIALIATVIPLGGIWVERRLLHPTGVAAA